jgi:hypothetical protein
VGGHAPPLPAPSDTDAEGPPVRRSTTLLTLLLGVLLVGGLASPSVAAPSPLDVDELGVSVEVGYAGQAVRGRWLPVAVTLAPTRLFAGDVGVVAETETGRMVESREVEVAAGSTKIFRFLLPPSHDVTVQLSATGASDGVTISAPVRFADTFLVGVLGDTVPSDAPPISSQPLDQRGTLVPVPTGFLERSSRALDPLSALISGPDELAALSDTTRARLATAVASGTDLVLVASTDGAIDTGLPWQSATAATTVRVTTPERGSQSARVLEPGPTAWGVTPAELGMGDDTRPIATAVNAGKGRVLVSGVALGDGPIGSDGAYWAQLLQPNRPTTGSIQNDGLARIAQAAGEGLRSDTVSLPAMPLLVGFLVAYLVLVGPVNGFVLARLGRRELAWLTIPALTVVFSAGAFVASAGAASSTGLSGRAAYWIDGQGAQLQTAAIRAPRQGEHELVLPGGDWDVAPAAWSPAPAVVDRSGSDTVMRLSLEALQVGTATAYRDIDGAAPLGIDIDPLSEGARVTVTNRSPNTVAGVEVRAGTLARQVGTLASGETRSVELDGNELPVMQERHDDFSGLREPDGRVVAPRSLEALLRWGVVDGNPGIVWATGTASSDLGLGTPAVDGATTDDRGTFLAVGVTPGLPGTDTLPWEADRRLLTVGFGDVWRQGPLAIEGRVEAVLRFRLPNEGPVDTLVPSLHRGQLDGRFPPDGPPQPVPAPGRDMAMECQDVQLRDPDGNLRGVEEQCFPVDPRTGERLDRRPGVPPCPPEAVSCDFSGDSWTFCFADGRCEGGAVAVAEPREGPPPVPGRGVGGLEVYDHVARDWVAVGEAFDAGRDSRRLLSALGEVYVRAVGELRPFDYSGRGIAATRGET